MALDVASLTLDDSQASLASMPEALWRKVTSYLRPATTARAFVVASGSGSLQNALRAEIEQTERAMFGMTRREADGSPHLDQDISLPPWRAAPRRRGGRARGWA